MPAFVVVDVDIRDPEQYEEYKRLTPGSLVPFGGRFVVRGGKTETLEGTWAPRRLVILEFGGTGEGMVELRRLPAREGAASGQLAHRDDPGRGRVTARRC
jgi:uncharacterized protein (DUF1330 family)